MVHRSPSFGKEMCGIRNNQNILLKNIMIKKNMEINVLKHLLCHDLSGLRTEFCVGFEMRSRTYLKELFNFCGYGKIEQRNRNRRPSKICQRIRHEPAKNIFRQGSEHFRTHPDSQNHSSRCMRSGTKLLAYRV